MNRVSAHIDHLVVMADSLEQGERWCQTTLGITPGPGGKHALMGTHNRLFRVDSATHPACYFEIIAIDPDASPQRKRRWFGMDDAELQSRVRENGPQLIHWVMGSDRPETLSAHWRTLGLDTGPLVQAQRDTAHGLLQWRLSVRDDGQTLLDGTLPTLIAWNSPHPVAHMPDSGIHLQRLQLSHPDVTLLHSALDGLGLDNVLIREGSPGLRATLSTPQGEVVIGG